MQLLPQTPTWNYGAVLRDLITPGILLGLLCTLVIGSYFSALLADNHMRHLRLWKPSDVLFTQSDDSVCVCVNLLTYSASFTATAGFFSFIIPAPLDLNRGSAFYLPVSMKILSNFIHRHTVQICRRCHSPWAQQLHGAFQASSEHHGTQRTSKASVSELIFGLVPGKVHSALGDPGCTEPFLTGIV